MCLAELETAARLGRDVRVVVFDDATLSLIAIKQGAGQGGAEAVRYAAGDLAAVARGLGLRGRRGRRRRGRSRRRSRGAGPSLTAAQIDPSGYRAVLAAIRA